MYRDKKNKNELVLLNTPFYAESGGQIGDTGYITSKGFSFEVENTYKDGDFICHYGTVKEGDLDKLKNKEVVSSINIDKRLKIRLNHTATHLLHKALKLVLGEHVQQAGSLVADDRLRFDLTHYQKISKNEILEIEDIVNNIIRNNVLLDTNITSFEDAKNSGAEALFGEKYSDKVRVIDIPGFSKELCGGTHVKSTGDIGLFKIITESSLSTGVRRIEAITGKYAFDYLRNNFYSLSDLALNFNCNINDVQAKVLELENKSKKYKNDLKEINVILGKKLVSDLYNNKQKINNISFFSGILNLSIAPKDLSDIALELLTGEGVSLLGIQSNDTNILVCSVTKDICADIKASYLLKTIAQNFKLNAGGSNHMAIMSFKDNKMLNKSIELGTKLINKDIR